MASLKDFFSRSAGSKKVLAFDGGGVRAIAGLIFLQKLEVESGKKISDMFDMFVGVSAGALNALCFGVNEMTAKETKDYWAKEYIDEITSSNFFWDKASIIQARPKYENTGRIEVLKKIFYDKSNSVSNIGYTGLIGVFFLIIYSYFSHFFIAHGYFHNVLVLLLGLIIFFISHQFCLKS